MMKWMSRMLVILAVAVGFSATFAAAQQSQPAEDVYDDIEVLNGMPANQLNATMQFFEASLGVGCDYCHADDRAADTEIKDVARDMVTLVHDINNNTFEGDREVTCWTCHRGRVQPPEDPALATSDYVDWHWDSTNGSPNAPPVPGPAPAEVLDQFIASLGGMDTLNGITSRVVRFNSTDSEGNIYTGEHISKGNDGLLMNINAGTTWGRMGGDGWFRAANGNVRDIRTYEFNNTRFYDLLYLAKNAKSFSALETRQSTIRGGLDVYEVRGVAPGNVPVRMYFGRGTGHLVRVLWFSDTPVGENPARIDFNQYDEVGDTLYPMLWTIRTPLTYQTARIESVQDNVDIDDSRFNRPPPRR